MTTHSIEYADVLRWLPDRQHLLLCSHTKPDGDAIGSLRGLGGLLATMEKKSTVIAFDPCPGRYAHLMQEQNAIQWAQADPNIAERYDGLVLLDTCAYSQLEPLEPFLRQHSLDVLVVDHHDTSDPIGDIRVIDSSASSTCLMVFELAEACGCPLDLETAVALFTGMATDTGWFRFSSVDARTLRAASQLIECGVRPNEIYETLYLNEKSTRLRLLGELLASAEFFDDDRLAVASLDPEAFKRAGATPDMTEDLINELNRVGTIVVAALFVAQEKGPVRVSLRSKRTVDVAELARRFGGGGHQRAAGARIDGELDSVKNKVIEEIRRVLSKTT